MFNADKSMSLAFILYYQLLVVGNFSINDTVHGVMYLVLHSHHAPSPALTPELGRENGPGERGELCPHHDHAVLS